METVGLDFIERAPLQLTFHADLAAPPDRVWGALSDELDTWTWFPTLTGGRTLTGRRDEVGATCEVHVGGLTAIETILASDPGRRWAYGVTELAIPIASALVEDWVLTPLPATSTRPLGTHLTYTFALDPRPVARYLTTFSAASIALIVGKATQNLDRRLAAPA
jgi:hypothetical protein